MKLSKSKVIGLSCALIGATCSSVASIQGAHPIIIVNGTGASTSFFAHGSNNGGNTIILADGQACYIAQGTWGFSNNKNISGRFYIETDDHAYNAIRSDWTKWGEVYYPVFASNIKDGVGKSESGWDRFYEGVSLNWYGCDSDSRGWKQSTSEPHSMCANNEVNRPIIIGIARAGITPAVLSSEVKNVDDYISSYANGEIPACKIPNIS
jgi:hypothetical protein